MTGVRKRRKLSSGSLGIYVIRRFLKCPINSDRNRSPWRARTMVELVFAGKGRAGLIVRKASSPRKVWRATRESGSAGRASKCREGEYPGQDVGVRRIKRSGWGLQSLGAPTRGFGESA
ncbi:hypothetical protein KM043_000571 [Ampulex compressa]|nr:hypothetical protein KM043_000571 [Ampulex compressa]